MRAIVELSGDGGATQPSHQHPYHVERLTADAEGHLNLQRLVPYPPGVEHVPVKPLFFDAAWNYIKYPGHESESQEAAAVPEVSKVEEQPTQQKKGWFGFGR